MALENITSMDSVDKGTLDTPRGNDVVDLDTGKPVDAAETQTDASTSDAEEKEETPVSTEEKEGTKDEREQHIPRKRFDEVHKERNELRERVAQSAQKAAAFDELANMPEFQKFMSDYYAGRSASATPAAAPTLENINFEEMNDQQIAESLTGYVQHQIQQGIESRLAALENSVNGISGNQLKAERDALFKGNEMANENRQAVEEKMGLGLTFDEAYYAVCGSKLKDLGFQEGLQRTKEKHDNNPTPVGKVAPKGMTNSKRPDNVQEAWNMIKAERGL